MIFLAIFLFNCVSATRFASEISIYGNGKVFNVLPVHHTLIVVRYDAGTTNQSYELYEINREGTKMRVYRSPGEKTEELAVGWRLNKKALAEKWGESARVNCSESAIKAVATKYNGLWYNGFSHFGPVQRNFALKNSSDINARSLFDSRTSFVEFLDGLSSYGPFYGGNCRTFVNEVLKSCNSQRRIENWFEFKREQELNSTNTHTN